MPEKPETGPKGRGANDLAARLAAVQAVYQMSLNPQSVAKTLQEYLEDHRNHIRTGEAGYTAPNGALLKNILLGLEERRGQIEEIMQANIRQRDSNGMEPLLKSILLCGVYEIVAHGDTDHPLIINDYLDIAHGFYEKQQVSFINAVLDSSASVFRVKST